MAEQKNDNTYLAPLIGSIILTGLWGAYTIFIVYEMALMPLPS